MRAVMVREFGSYSDSAVEQLSAPNVGPGQVLLRIEAVPVNYVDLVTFEGRYQFAPALPYVPGKCPVGVVAAVGSDVRSVAVGDRVLAMNEYGGYADAALVDADRVFGLPDSLGFVEAASMSLAFDTAWMALRERARLQAGESVLVLGASGAVGAASLQLARALGADVVLAGISSPDQADAALANGATAVVYLGGDDPRSEIRAQVERHASGRVDVVIDPVGGDAFDGAVRALAWRGRLVVVGFASGRIPTLKVNYLMLKNIEVSGIQISDYRLRTPDLMRACYEEIFALADQGVLRPLPADTFPLEDWAIALQRIGERGGARRRLVLVPSRQRKEAVL